MTNSRKDSHSFLFTLLTAIVFLTPLIQQMLNNNYVKVAEDIAYLLMLLISVYLMVRRNIRFKINALAGCLLILLALFSLIGGYYSGMMVIMLQIRELKYLLLIVILLPFGEVDTFRQIWPALKVFAYGCIPVSILQRILYGTDGDRVTGLLGYGGSGTLTLFLLIIFFSELGLRLKENAPIAGPYFLLLLPTVLNETKIMIVLFPVLLYSTLIITKKININILILSVIICLVLLAAWGYVYESTYGSSLKAILSPEYFESYMLATNWEVDAGRVAKIIYAVEVIKDENFLLGYGLGASYTGATSGARGFILTHINYPQMFGGTRPQLFVSLIETGIIGVVAIISMITFIAVKLYKVKVNSLEKLIAFNAAIVILAAFVYQSIFFTYQIMYIFVLFTFLAFKFSVREETASEGVMA